MFPLRIRISDPDPRHGPRWSFWTRRPRRTARRLLVSVEEPTLSSFSKPGVPIEGARGSPEEAGAALVKAALQHPTDAPPARTTALRTLLNELLKLPSGDRRPPPSENDSQSAGQLN